ncbi:MAG TPA: amino acid deaminase/aldolase [Solirubrobacteraceae bacterium]|nr:amino acid deaminase/aldolase [Solirubrobacteraceae bacterium]
MSAAAAPAQAPAASAYERLERATAELTPPFALVDLDAMEHNARDMEQRAGGKPIRLASKSVRCRALQERVLARAGFRGTMAFTLPEALWLASEGTEDLLVAYPTADAEALRELAAGAADVTVMVDSAEGLRLIDRALDGAPGGPVSVCLDIDAGWRAAGGRIRVGARRSPVRTPADAAALAREVLARERLQVAGIMAYEAQIAGVGDEPPGSPLRGRAIRAMQVRSARELAARRGAIVAAVAEVLSAAGAPPLRFVNGGGTGSLHGTAAEAAVTEVAAGSGLYGPTLFDAYSAFTPRPAALFALPVVRRPGRGVVTALGGGYLASGPADAARLPRPYLPEGLRLDRQEGAGEVQTPLLGEAAEKLALGDRVYFRHAKAGELCERFDALHLIEGERVVEQAPTYRGEGRCFL